MISFIIGNETGRWWKTQYLRKMGRSGAKSKGRREGWKWVDDGMKGQAAQRLCNKIDIYMYHFRQISVRIEGTGLPSQLSE